LNGSMPTRQPTRQVRSLPRSAERSAVPYEHPLDADEAMTMKDCMIVLRMFSADHPA